MMKKNLLRIVIAAVCMVLGGVQAVAQQKEAYAALSDDGKTVTFYYDTQKENRGGMGINSSSRGNPYANVTTAVFDASFADYRPTSTAYWFSNCYALTTISGIENLNTVNVTNMSLMFHYCSSLTSLDLSEFNTVNVTDMSYMFYYCSSLTSLDVSKFNTVNVTDMSEMFGYCSALTSLDVSRFNTANVTDMAAMFEWCNALTSLDVSEFNTASVTKMRSMFLYCSSLTSLDVSGWNTVNVTDMGTMFWGCSALTSLDMSGWNTANVTNMNSMFSDCSTLTTVYADEAKWSTAAVTNGSYMFDNCTALVGGNGTKYDANHTNAEYARIDKPGQSGYLTQKLATGIRNIQANGTETTAGDGQWYTLGGQRIGSEQPQQKGVYVVNGRKVMTR